MDTVPNTLSRWIEIDLDAITYNITQVKARLDSVELMAVVKGDAYGCGSVACAKAAVAAGCAMLGVTTLEEAMELRYHDIVSPILIFSPILTHEVPLFIQYHLTPTVIDIGVLVHMEELIPDNEIFPIQIKIETGMGRLGLKPQDLPGILAVLYKSGKLKLEGIYTHFAKATDSKYVKLQAHRLVQAREICLENGFKDFSLHACASATYLNYPEYHFDMVRIGTLLYGQQPAGISSDTAFLDSWKAKAKVVQINNVLSGESIGYGRDFVADKSMRIAIVPIGIADGFSLSPPIKAKGLIDLLRIVVKEIIKFTAPTLKISSSVFFQGNPLPLVGRVGMQLLAVDITSFPEMILGDTVEFELRRTSTSARLARVYLKDGKICDVRSIAQALGEKIVKGVEM